VGADRETCVSEASRSARERIARQRHGRTHILPRRRSACCNPQVHGPALKAENARKRCSERSPAPRPSGGPSHRRRLRGNVFGGRPHLFSAKIVRSEGSGDGVGGAVISVVGWVGGVVALRAGRPRPLGRAAGGAGGVRDRCGVRRPAIRRAPPSGDGDPLAPVCAWALRRTLFAASSQ
jgi:hypothetical protein